MREREEQLRSCPHKVEGPRKFRKTISALVACQIDAIKDRKNAEVSGEKAR